MIRAIWLFFLGPIWEVRDVNCKSGKDIPGTRLHPPKGRRATYLQCRRFFKRTEPKPGHILKLQAVMRKHRPLHSDLPTEARLRANARSYANVYLRRGKLKRQPCQCGSPDSEMHHEDYSKPLDVVWLCSSCHHLVHEWKELCSC